MTEIQNLLQEAIQSDEFGPFLDWIEEQGCVNLKARISNMLQRGESQWLASVYFSHMGDGALSDLEAKAAQANLLLGIEP